MNLFITSSLLTVVLLNCIQVNDKVHVFQCLTLSLHWHWDDGRCWKRESPTETMLLDQNRLLAWNGGKEGGGEKKKQKIAFENDRIIQCIIL